MTENCASHNSDHSIIKLLLLILVAILLTACGGSDNTIDNTINVTLPAVIYNTPDYGSTDVSTDVSISVTFNKNMDASTITTQTFILESGGINVPGTVSYNDMTATFTPLVALDFNKTYKATVNNGVKDIAGNALPRDHTWMFATCNENGSCSVRDCRGVARKNIILFIGDGMGFEEVRAAGMYANGVEGTLSFEGFTNKASVTTDNIWGDITDSAAAATAMATGEKVGNGVISEAIPGDGSPHETLLEIHKGVCRSTGLVTTTYIAHATPAAFGAHTSSRSNYSEIVTDYLQDARPNVLFGGAVYINSTNAANAGYTVVTDNTALQGVNTSNVLLLSGQFGNGNMPYEYDGDYSLLPHLSDMTATALDMLDKDPEGFFLMVEGGRIDHAGHGNSIERNIMETVEFSNAVRAATDWANGRTDTLILVTADHETGGLSVLQNNGAGVFPLVSWSSGGHTGVDVPLYAWGQNAEQVSGLLDNTEIFSIAQ
jgi:alkaline phosphatase